MNRTCVVVVGRDSRLLSEAWRQLDPSRFDVEVAPDVSALRTRPESAPIPDVILLDAAVIEPAHTDLIRELRQLYPSVKIVVHVSRSDLSQIMETIGTGANGWVWSPVQDGELIRALKSCFEHSNHLQTTGGDASGYTAPTDDGAFFAGTSEAMRKIRLDLERVATTDVPVLCIGERGTGTKLAARWLHRLSRRANHPFINVDCAAMPEHVLESELFGYEGEPTSPANANAPGLVGQCQGGTLFLDEVTEMPVSVQVRLLEVIEHRAFMTFSGGQREAASVRMVGGSSADIRDALARRRLTEELYYRLTAFIFEIPPLRERPEDIPLLLRRFITKHALNLGLPERTVSAEILQWCRQYYWPGNITQLGTFAESYVLFGGRAAELLAGGIAADAVPIVPPSDLKAHVRDMRDRAESAAIATALQQTNWNRKAAADLLHISYRSLLAKIRHYRLDQQKAAGTS